MQCGLSQKQPDYFAERGELTTKEIDLLTRLADYIEAQRVRISRFEKSTLISQEAINEDSAKARRQRQKNKEGDDFLRHKDLEKFFATKRGVLAEGAIIYGMQRGNWFGENSQIVVASEYDDYFNRVDAIVEFGVEKQLALGIDTTISRDKIEGKLKEILDDVEDGKLATIKYYKSDSFEGSLLNVPLCVVGASRTASASLARNVAHLEIDIVREKEEQAHKEIQEHQIQFTILLQIEMQLAVFIHFAEKNGHKYLVPKLKGDLIKIREVIKEKFPKDKIQNQKIRAVAEQDEVSRLIRQALEIALSVRS